MTHDPHADPLDPIMRQRIDAAAANVVDFVQGGTLKPSAARLSTLEAQVRAHAIGGAQPRQIAALLGIKRRAAAEAGRRLRRKGAL
jgi:FixJ family two-component response regulator